MDGVPGPGSAPKPKKDDTSTKPESEACSRATQVLQDAGEGLSTNGEIFTWAGIGLLGASGVGLVAAPEGIELEAPGAVDGYAMIQFGNAMSLVGTALQGIAADGAKGEANNLV